MRLLVVEPGLKLWGSERAFLATVPALAAACEKLVILAPPGAELIDALPPGSAVVDTAPIGNLHRSGVQGRMRAAASIALACHRHRIDRIYLNQAGMCRLVHGVARLMRLPSIMHVRLQEDIARCAALRATTGAPVDLVFVSDDMRRRYSTVGAFDRHKRLHLAYDPFEISTGAPARPACTRSLACIGRLDANKGQMALVDALAIASARGCDLELDVIGAGIAGDRYEAAVRSRVRSLGLTDRVAFLGYRQDAAQLLGGYRFIAVPSRYEALGRVVFEAWDAGAVPICSKDSGGAAEVVAASGGGLLYLGHEPESIARALCAAAELPESERGALVARGQAWLREQHSVAAYIKALSGVLFPPLAAGARDEVRHADGGSVHYERI